MTSFVFAKKLFIRNYVLAHICICVNFGSLLSERKEIHLYDFFVLVFLKFNVLCSFAVYIYIYMSLETESCKG